jgi:hypothetical protein
LHSRFLFWEAAFLYVCNDYFYVAYMRNSTYMNRLFQILAAGTLLFGFNACKPDGNAPKPQGWTCSFDGSPLIYRAHGSALVLPTAFTPNGDGFNDFFRVMDSNIRTDDFLLEIQTSSGEEVFRSTDPDAVWNGSSPALLLSGVEHRLRLRFTTASGQVVDTCAGITPFLYDRSNDCLPAGGKTYYFEDQFDGVAGFPYTSGEIICP